MLQERLKPFVQRFLEINELLASLEVTSDIERLMSLSKEQADIKELAQKSQEYLSLLQGIQDNKDLVLDEELGELAKEELKTQEMQKLKLEQEIKLLLIPKDPNDERNIIIEIRAGTGGDEAAIFAGDLYRAYIRYAQAKNFRIEIMSSSPSDFDGYKEIIFTISGEKPYSLFKYEAGTHRVQRVPQTESQGRVHTSAITVAIMPEADDVEININPSDLKIDVFRSSGHGGQSVNTTDSAVRITHVPTGIVVSMQDEKSQHKNKDKAMKILRSRLYEQQLQAQQAEQASARKAQVGSGDRSERIRTYNYPQNRITDHRAGLSLYRLEEIMSGGLLDELVGPVNAYYQAQALEQS